MTVRVKQYQTLGPEIRAYVDIGWQWTPLQLVLTPGPNGVALRGLVMNGAVTLFPESAPWFRTDVSAGTTWTTPVGPGTLVSKTEVVTVGAQTYTAWHYQLLGLDWYLSPDAGLVQFGSGNGAFVMRASTLNPVPVVSRNASPGPCPLIGLDADPAVNSTMTDLQAINLAVTNGARFGRLGLTWAEIEPQPGVYDFSVLRAWLGRMAPYQMALALTLRTVDTDTFSTPPDLQGLAMDDPRVLSRFTQMLTALEAAGGSALRWIELGNEIQTYLGTDPNLWNKFATLYSTGLQTLHRLQPGLSVGVVIDYSYTRATATTMAAVIAASDHIAFTYYPWDSAFTYRSPSAVAIDLADIVQMASGKPIVITEAGFPSSTALGSSPAIQNQFYSAMFGQLKIYSGRISAANFFQLSDLPDSITSQLLSYYQLNDAGQAYAFEQSIGTLGLRNTDGTPKPAWATFSTNSSAFLAAHSCTRQ